MLHHTFTATDSSSSSSVVTVSVSPAEICIDFLLCHSEAALLNSSLSRLLPGRVCSLETLRVSLQNHRQIKTSDAFVSHVTQTTNMGGGQKTSVFSHHKYRSSCSEVSGSKH